MASDADLLTLFDRLDKDKSQTLSVSELRRAFEKKGLPEKEVDVCLLSKLTLLLTSIVYEYTRITTWAIQKLTRLNKIFVLPKISS